MFRLTIIISLLIIVCAKNVASEKLRAEDSTSESDESTSGKRTLMITKLTLLPILAGVGLKFLVLLPIVLSKIALLGILSFVSSNLSLLASAVMGVRSYFFENGPTEEEYDYDSHYKSHTDSHDDHGHDENNYDPYDKYMHRYRGHEHSHPEYNPHHSKYRYHDDRKHSKRRFRPFKLLERIKNAIKDHFHKSEGHGDKYREYDNDYKHYSHDLSDDHNEYSHHMRESKYRIPDYEMLNHHSDLEGKYYGVYKVPQDWSHKDEVTSNHLQKGEKHQDHSMSVSSGLLDSQFKIPLKDNTGELMHANSNVTQLQTTGYKISENDPKFKEPFIVLGLRAQAQDSDSPGAFYTTDYKITDFQTIPQADTSK